MRALLLFLVVAPSLAPLWADDSPNPFLVVPINATLLKDDLVRDFFVDILQQGGLGYRQTEAAAFLVLRGDGEYRCVSWSFHGGYHRQQFRGKAPDDTIAIIHTHPEGSPLASAGDRRTAMALGIPVFVLTRHNIYMVTADGSSVAVEKGRFWSGGAKRERRCTRG